MHSLLVYTMGHWAVPAGELRRDTCQHPHNRRSNPCSALARRRNSVAAPMLFPPSASPYVSTERFSASRSADGQLGSAGWSRRVRRDSAPTDVAILAGNGVIHPALRRLRIVRCGRALPRHESPPPRHSERLLAAEDVRREPARRPDAVRMAAALERLPATARPPFPRVLRGLPPSQSIREDIHVAGLRGLQVGPLFSWRHCN